MAFRLPLTDLSHPLVKSKEWKKVEAGRRRRDKEEEGQGGEKEKEREQDRLPLFVGITISGQQLFSRTKENILNGGKEKKRREEGRRGRKGRRLKRRKG